MKTKLPLARFDDSGYLASTNKVKAQLSGSSHENFANQLCSLLFKSVMNHWKKRMRLFDSLQQLTPAQLAFKPRPRAWSILEVIEYLILVKQGSLSYFCKKLGELSALEQIARIQKAHRQSP